MSDMRAPSSRMLWGIGASYYGPVPVTPCKQLEVLFINASVRFGVSAGLILAQWLVTIYGSCRSSKPNRS